MLWNLARFLTLSLVLGLLAGCPWDDDDDDDEAPPSALSYAPASVAGTTGQALGPLRPTVTGAVTSYAIAPALPAGLAINAGTGEIGGTPTATSAATNYTVTATNAQGSTTAAVSITVNLGAPRNLTYSSPATAVVGTAITPLLPTVTNAVASWSVTPALPAGLALDAASGQVSGTPTAVTAQASYTVMATNAAGSTTFALSLTVNPAAPMNLTYASPQVVSRGRAIAPLLPMVTGSATSYAVSPALPAGLAIDPATGIITGTPTAEVAEAQYTVTASNVTGSTTFALRLTVAAVLSNTVLDPSFNGIGILGIDFDRDTDIAKGVVLQPDGRILVTGETNGATRQLGTARVDADGTLDASFGTAGLARTQVRTADGVDVAEGVALQADGRIVLAGDTRLGNVEDVATARLNADGSADTSTDGDNTSAFDTDGVRTDVLGTRRDYGEEVVVQADGAIAVAVSFGVSFDEQNFGVLRLRANGSRDPTFGTNGLVTTASPGTASEHPRDMVLQPDGSIVLVGDSNDSSADIVVMRYLATGALDASFGNGGVVRTSFGANLDRVTSVALQADGRIVVGGTAGTGGGNTDVLVLRLNANGSLDTSFGGDGFVTLNFGTPGNLLGVVLVQADGRIVAAGSVGTSGNRDILLTRLNADGSTDVDFGIDGVVRTDIASLEGINDGVIQPDGAIVLVGIVDRGSAATGFDYLLLRYIDRALLP